MHRIDVKIDVSAPVSLTFIALSSRRPGTEQLPNSVRDLPKS